MPLAIDLIAHLVDYEGFSSVLNRWETERTSLLSEGHDKRSNLDLSISLSLESPRLDSVPHSRDLLSLLSMLPDGLSDIELLQARLPIDNILACKATLLSTSLANTDDRRRLKALVPIREYVGKISPPTVHLVQPLQNHFQQSLRIYDNLLVSGLKKDNPDLHNNIYYACIFHQFTLIAGHQIPLLSQIANALPDPRDPRLEVQFMVQRLAEMPHSKFPDAPTLVARALEYFPGFDDPDLKCKFFNNVARYHGSNSDLAQATHFAQTGLTLSIFAGNTRRQTDSLAMLAAMKWQAEAGKYFCIYQNSVPLLARAQVLLGLCGMSGSTLDYSLITSQAEAPRVKSEYVEARTLYEQIIRDVYPEQDPYQHAWALSNSTEIDVLTRTSQHQDIQTNLNIAKSIFNSMKMSVLGCDPVQTAIYLQTGDLLAAQTLLQKCLGCAWGHNVAATISCLQWLGDVSRWGTTNHTSSTWTMTLLAYSLKLKQKLQIHTALQFLGDVFLAKLNYDTAISLFTVALEGFTQMDVHSSRAECMICLGDIAKMHGELQKGVELWKTARSLFERSSQPKQVAHIDARLTGIGDLSADNFGVLAHLSSLHAPSGCMEELNAGPSATAWSKINDMEDLALEDDTNIVLVPA
ncbi:hypothetical protein FB451DRAFT_1188846 [Mycena latifolia]|nr:hypothetical protein FB451DRAFT_1188846 [Mycena latifolia]